MGTGEDEGAWAGGEGLRWLAGGRVAGVLRRKGGERGGTNGENHQVALPPPAATPAV